MISNDSKCVLSHMHLCWLKSLLIGVYVNVCDVKKQQQWRYKSDSGVKQM